MTFIRAEDVQITYGGEAVLKASENLIILVGWTGIEPAASGVTGPLECFLL
jgi:hypothetical protein